MTNSVAIFDKQMNITSLYLSSVNFQCTACDWVGTATELVTHKQFLSCPKCKNNDVRVQNDMGDI